MRLLWVRKATCFRSRCRVLKREERLSRLLANVRRVADDLDPADFATSALDPEMIGEVLEVMRDFARDGTTMLVVTREMGFAREFLNRILLKI